MKSVFNALLLISCVVVFAAMEKQLSLPVSLIPTSHLTDLGLCPLYPRYEEFTVEGKSYKSMLPVKFKRVGSWDLQIVDKEHALKLMPCIKQGKDFEKD